MMLLQSAGILVFAVSVTISLLPTKSVKESSSAHAIFSSVYNDAFLHHAQADQYMQDEVHSVQQALQVSNFCFSCFSDPFSNN